MRIQTTHQTLYTYDELSEDAKRRARDWCSQLNGEHWDGADMYDDFVQVAKCLGVTFDTRTETYYRPGDQTPHKSAPKPCIWWSGFSSQGDGACFEGRYDFRADSVAAIKEYAPTDVELHQIAAGLAELQTQYDCTLSARVKHAGHYYHKYCTEIEWTAQTADGNDDRDVTADDQKAGSALLRDFMQWMYDALEKEYTYQTSDACAEETIKGNDWEFTEDGGRPCAC